MEGWRQPGLQVVDLFLLLALVECAIMRYYPIAEEQQQSKTKNKVCVCIR